MEHLSRTQYESLPQADRDWHDYELNVENNRMLKIHDPVIQRILRVEEAGRTTGKFLVRVFFVALTAGATVLLTNHFGTK